LKRSNLSSIPAARVAAQLNTFGSWGSDAGLDWEEFVTHTTAAYLATSTPSAAATSAAGASATSASSSASHKQSK
jgi:hypothetical protein